MLVGVCVLVGVIVGVGVGHGYKVYPKSLHGTEI